MRKKFDVFLALINGMKLVSIGLLIEEMFSILAEIHRADEVDAFGEVLLCRQDCKGGVGHALMGHFLVHYFPGHDLFLDG